MIGRPPHGVSRQWAVVAAMEATAAVPD